MKKIILDTDMGPDCDDAGALSILCRYHAADKCELLAVTHCTSDVLGCDVIAAINEWYGIDVPIGQTTREGFLDHLEARRYSVPISEQYRQKHGERKYEDAVAVLRRTLAQNKNVTLIFIGPLNNMKELLLSGPDDISEKSGVELVRESADELIVMGGHFSDFNYGEYNIKCDVPAAQATCETCPCPIVWCGFEAGIDVMTGATLEACSEDYPVRTAYKYFLNGGFVRNSWDLVTVYYALTPEDKRWIVSDDCEVRYNDDATAVVSQGTGDRFVRFSDERELERILNGIIDGTAEIA